jgi:hypothetical protein
MAKGYWSSASIVFLPFGVDTDWPIQATNVHSPLLLTPPHFSRGIFDLTTATDPNSGEPITLPLDIVITVKAIDGTVPNPPPPLIAQSLTADLASSSTKADNQTFTVDAEYIYL